MADRDDPPALGEPGPDAADPGGTTDDTDGADFANEHEDTAVDESITEGRDRGESESPHGWSGLEERDRSGN
ncbi:hypothetical protein O7635_00705 [Asanoa sp. WMMD1127]|uniref:hypothetical protein n=1 Tax=Asanoa sp. WMMD1127 TaxID=3016107 RepID=UPI00241691C1|nr:hypothetical protein [Asanoa sp. WMMD1127]MDG4820370.1 hypothetical protein [Asanoa sp. WMMD1127]